ncbi:hypothetical protein L227DRAFT_572121 [Lentinus tigrinus ALCF2SS1-6]|uniref:Uncharacterized protein n=1 Tax=Lentinus tigrinus ALCF2SS1-6 TaxID=1328759 RepID=A0A5C2SJA7_9APHY|nr:hypothetical protein L227DRAFT_572121 [Lentinus tigrinus ALCF2SS1-6]
MCLILAQGPSFMHMHMLHLSGHNMVFFSAPPSATSLYSSYLLCSKIYVRLLRANIRS